MRASFSILIVLLLALVLVGSVAAQDEPPEGVATEPSPVVVVQVPKYEIPDEIRNATYDNVIAAVFLFSAVIFIVGGVLAGYVIRHVSNLVPAQFAAPVYTTGNTYYETRQQYIHRKRQEALLNTIAWDDPFWENAEKASTEDWQRFVDEAKAKGITLRGPAQQAVPG